MKQQTYKILNEEFFDDSELTDDDIEVTDDEAINEHDYTYHFQFLFFTWSLVSNVITKQYHFENPEYKASVESSLLSLRNSIEYILKYSPIVTDYSTPKFCTTDSKFITEFPYMNNKPSEEFEDKSDQALSLETSINLSDKKNINNLTKFIYSFWRLQLIYDRLIDDKIHARYRIKPDIKLNVFRKNPDEKIKVFELIDDEHKLTNISHKLINFLNDER